MALDYGSKTVGVAVTDALMLTVQPVEIIRREHEDKLRRTLARIETLVREYSVDMIVLGLPLNMDETEGERAEKTRAFGVKLQARIGMVPHFQDERLTSVEAEERMREAGMNRQEIKEHVDQVAAAIILEDFLSLHSELREQV